MLAQDYLTLRLVRLRHPEEWVYKEGALLFVFPKGGVGNCSCGPLNQRVAPGDVLVLDGAVGGRLSVPNRGEIVFSCFSVCLEHLFPLFASNEICLLQAVTDDFKPAKLYPASSPLAMECHRLLGEVPPQFNLDHRSQLLRVAAAILTVEFKNAHGQRVGFIRPDEHMIQVFEKLSNAELVGLSVPELASRFGCSRRHLNRLFHHHFGVSVAALRMELRLLKAMALLRNPDAKVINVAEECGFNHLGLFNTCFKRRFGTSPGQWRKRAPSGENELAGFVGSAVTCPLRVNGLCPATGQPANAAATLQPPSQTQAPVQVAASKSPPALGAGPKRSLSPEQQKPDHGASARAFAAS